jgi:type IV pilus assembly protein PilW
MTMNHLRLRGFTLIELMVALAVGFILLMGMALYFVSSSRAFSETGRVNQQIENGRYALALLSEEIRHAGFYGEVGDVASLPMGSAIALPGALPDPCATAIADVAAALSLPLQGVDAPDTAPTCLPDDLAGTDVLVVRQSSTAIATAGSAEAIGNGYYTQVAYCVTAAPMFRIAQSGFTLTGKDCTTVNPVRQFHVYLYYVATCSKGTGTGGACQSSDPRIPTLKRAELVAGGSFTLTPLVDGIEDMQIEYGLDTNSDGSPDLFKANPASVAEWAQVVAIRLNVLARNVDATPGLTPDTKTYTLGKDRDGNDKISTPGGSYHRHNYKELVRVQNVSQRIETSYGGS